MPSSRAVASPAMEATRALTAPSRARQVVADYVALTKPKVQSLLLFTTVTTMLVAGTPSVGLVLATCLGGYLSAGGAGAINHSFDRDIDAQMARTATRPVAVGPHHARAPALLFGVVLARLRSRCSATAVNLLAAPGPARLRRATSVVYTMWLKRRTPQNIVIGGAAGAVPPLVGWAAVTGTLSRDRDLPLRDRLLLDAAALLGALAAHEGRVRAGRRADAARRARRGARRGARSCSTRCCSTRSRSCRSARAASATIYLVASLVLGARFIGGAVLLRRRADRRSRAAAVPLLTGLPGAAVRARWWPTSSCDPSRIQAPWTATSPARTSAPASSSPRRLPASCSA